MNQKQLFTVWSRGILAYKLRDYQKVVYKQIRKWERDPDGPIISFVNCSRQTGKSYTTSLMLLEDCIREPNTYNAFITGTKIDAKDILRKVMRVILEDCPEQLKPKWRQDDYAYVFPNGSELAVLGADDEGQIDRIRGRPRHRIVVDEARNIRFLDDLIKSVLLPATLTTGGSIVLSTTPATSGAHESKSYYLQCKKNKALCEYTIWDAKKSNPEVFKESTINALAEAYGGMHSTAWKREFECRWVVEESLAIVPEWNTEVDRDDDGNIISRGNLLTYPVERDKYYGFYDKYIMMDMGTQHYTWIGFGYYWYPEGKLVMEREWFGNGPEITTKRIADVVKEIQEELGWDSMPSSIRRIADSNNPTLLNSLRSEYGVSFAPVKKNKLDTKVSILNGMVNKLRMFIENARIIVDPSMEFLAGCLENGVWTKNRDKFDESTEYGHYDGIAGLMYGVRHLSEHNNPVPTDINIDWSDPNLFVTPDAKRALSPMDPDAEELSKIFINKPTRIH